MRRHLSLLLTGLLAATVMTRAAEDPGQSYADAFILIQDGQADEAKSDWASAAAKYNAAADKLRALRAENPDWNPQVVEYRLRDVGTKLDALKTKLPEQPAPAASVETSNANALAVEFATPQATSRLRAEVERLRDENAKLASDLAQARKIPVVIPPNKQLEELKQQNRQLTEQLSNSEKEKADLRSQLAAPPSNESAEIKRLRSELSQTRAQLETAQKANQQIAELQRQNKELSAKLADAQKAAATALRSPGESADLKALRAELNKAREDANQAKAALAKAEAATKERADFGKQLADLEKQNSALRTQLAEARSSQALKTSAPVESAELKKLRGELRAARQQVEYARKTNRQQLINLQRENQQLNATLAAAQRKSQATGAESAELKQLRAELDAARVEADRAKAAAARVAQLEQQNRQLTAQLSSQPPAPHAELKQLRADLAEARAAADQAKQSNAKLAGLERENKYLAEQLAAARKAASSQNTGTASTNADLAELQKQNAELKLLFESATNRAARAAAPADSPEMQNLRSQLTVSQKRVNNLEQQLAGRTAARADAGELKKLQMDLAAARAELDKAKQANVNAAALTEQNRMLSNQLAAAQSQAAQAEELRAELARVTSQAEAAPAANTRVAELEKQNAQLAAQLQDAPKGPYVRPLTTEESAEIRQLRAQIDNMRAEVNRAQSANVRFDQLEKQNATLRLQLEQERKNAISRIEVIDKNPPGARIAPPAMSPKDAAIMKKLREENSYLRNLLETYAEKSPELKPSLRRYEQDRSIPAAQPTGTSGN
jgi:chromosome segregation ATPase